MTVNNTGHTFREYRESGIHTKKIPTITQRILEKPRMISIRMFLQQLHGYFLLMGHIRIHCS
jgi:hypothetical protein